MTNARPAGTIEWFFVVSVLSAASLGPLLKEEKDRQRTDNRFFFVVHCCCRADDVISMPVFSCVRVGDCISGMQRMRVSGFLVLQMTMLKIRARALSIAPSPQGFLRPRPCGAESGTQTEWNAPSVDVPSSPPFFVLSSSSSNCCGAEKRSFPPESLSFRAVCGWGGMVHCALWSAVD